MISATGMSAIIKLLSLTSKLNGVKISFLYSETHLSYCGKKVYPILFHLCRHVRIFNSLYCFHNSNR